MIVIMDSDSSDDSSDNDNDSTTSYQRILYQDNLEMHSQKRQHDRLRDRYLYDDSDDNDDNDDSDDSDK